VKLYVARHTQTNYNVKHLLNGDPAVDVHLTEKGIQQAKKLALKLQHSEIGAIYISELPRTRQTAEFVNKYHGVPVLVDKRLNDNRSGYEGQNRRAFLKAFLKSKDRWNARFNDGESIADVRERVEDFIGDLSKQNHGAVLVITSQIIIECMYGIINNTSFARAAVFDVRQGNYTVFNLD
jgi:probable phosphoglycerate mutase